ncbi:hypothetical protein D3Y59_12505 [Hymenobacter oligotrophus]|uniref:Uncharacterized protein n=1 Tax=Hymenobacter oligotrophus TaxID=2319843 RepID=A0A3B7R2Z9_9BACT|nr:hypothetical protein [Hymenobacter oligotrophus]AYA37793.1 hypothetical protein D3Y59_12505 [Hymenobacter oligotrophus]
MKTFCFSLIFAVLAAAPFEATYAAPTATPETTTHLAADTEDLGGGYKLKRKKRKKNRAMRRYRRLRGLR